MTEVIYNLPEAEYHARPELSKSQLDKFIASPLDYYDNYVSPTPAPRTQSPAFTLGSAVHCLLLEPDTYVDRFIVEPQGINKRTKEGKAIHAQFVEQAAGREILTAEQYSDAKAMCESVEGHKEAYRLLCDMTDAEASVIYEFNGLQMRSRWDGITNNGKIIDVKTTQDASYNGFEKSIINFNYQVQAFLYSRAYELAFGETPVFKFICVEKRRPFNVGIYDMDDNWLENGYQNALKATNHLKWCLQHNQWPKHNGNKTKTLKAPSWIVRKTERLAEENMNWVETTMKRVMSK